MINSADCGRCHMEKSCWPETTDAEAGVKVERQPAVAAGDFLWRQGDALHELLLLRHGCVKLFETLSDGSERVLQFALPGDLLGLEALSNGQHDCHALALDDVLVCRVVDEEPAASSAGLQQRLLWRASTLLRERQRAVRLADPDASLHEFLRTLAARIGRAIDAARGGGTLLRLPMSRREIGQYLGYAEETICRSLRRLHRRGLVQIRGRELTLREEAVAMRAAG